MKRFNIRLRLSLLIGLNLSIIVQGPISTTRALVYAVAYKLICPFSRLYISQYRRPSGHHLLTRLLSTIVECQPEPKAHCLHENHLRADKSIANNINLQILTASTALALVQTKYSIKLRSDCFFVPLAFLWIPSCAYNQRKIVAINYSIAPFLIFQNLKHPSDWFFFGLTTDVARLFMYYMPCSWLNAGAHILPSSQSYYKSERYTDLLQAEEYICLSYFAATFSLPWPSLTTIEALVTLANKHFGQHFLIAYGPSILCLHIGSKRNYWTPSSKRASIQQLRDSAVPTTGSQLECLAGLLYSSIRNTVW